MLIDLIEKNTAIWDTKSNDIHLLHKKLHRLQRNARSLHAAYYKIKSRAFLNLPLFIYVAFSSNLQFTFKPLKENCTANLNQTKLQKPQLQKHSKLAIHCAVQR